MGIRLLGQWLDQSCKTERWPSGIESYGLGVVIEHVGPWPCLSARIRASSQSLVFGPII